MFRSLRNYPLLAGAISGSILGATFPATGVGILALVALVPLILFGYKRPFASGFVSGICYFGVSLYWVNIVMVTYGHLPLPLSILLNLCLVAYLALFPACSYAGACWLGRRSGISHLLLFPLFWLVAEYARTFLLTGFPWGLIGYSLTSYSPLIQSADIFGVYGVGLLILLANSAIAFIVSRSATRQRLLHCYPALVLLLFVANSGYGWLSLTEKRDDPSLKVGVVQGNIDQSVKWNPIFKSETVRSYIELSDKARNAGAELIIWPESATPFYYQEGGYYPEKIQRLAKRLSGGLLFGSPAYVEGEERLSYLNSAYLVDSEGEIAGKSDKVHLVPYGEYVPLATLFPFVRKLAHGIGDFSSGENTPISSSSGKLGVLVCYESIFPAIARDLSRAGAELIVNITNDAWFGRSTAPHQHLQMSQWRAIENRKWLVRSANTGISSVINPVGRVVESTPLFQRAFLVTGVSVSNGLTIYARIGDLLPWVAILFLSSVFGWVTLRKKGIPTKTEMTS